MTSDEAAAEARSDKGLKGNAVTFWDGVAIGLDSTAPAYTIAAVLGSMALVVGTRTPAILLVSFLPMAAIASAFYYLNRADQDCGTTFAWVTRAMGPWLGWVGGWAIFITGVLINGAQADVAANYSLQVLGLDSLAANRPVVVGLAVVMIFVMTWICAIGIEISARVQRYMVLAQVGIIMLFVVAAIIAMVRGDVEADAPSFSLGWFNPLGVSPRDLMAGILLGIFCYWGWESGVNLNEETADGDVAAGKSAVVATVLLVITYVGSAVAVLGVLGLSTLEEYADDETLFGVVGDQVLGPFGWLLMLAIITSGLAATQTTILPASRTALSMAVAGAFPDRFQRIDPRRGTPAFATWVIGFVAAGFYVVGSIVSENFLFDAISALSILVALYYALTGFACAIYWRHELTRSLKAFVLIGLAPVLGGIVLIVVMVATAIDQADPANSYTGATVLGVGAPLGMAIVMFGTGLALQLISRVSYGKRYFTRTPFERVSDEVADATLGPRRRQGRRAARST